MHKGFILKVGEILYRWYIRVLLVTGKKSDEGDGQNSKCFHEYDRFKFNELTPGEAGEVCAVPGIHSFLLKS